ncbi:hypothetical protein Tco_0295035 [Tanacetum coccineum]
MAQENLRSLGESTSGYGYSYENDPKASCEITWGDSEDEDRLEKDATCLKEIESQEKVKKTVFTPSTVLQLVPEQFTQVFKLRSMAQENLMSLGESTSGYGYSYENDPKASCEITWGDSKDEDQLEKDATCLMEIESQELIQKATEREKEFYTLRMKFDQSLACWSINSASAAVWILVSFSKTRVWHL